MTITVGGGLWVEGSVLMEYILQSFQKFLVLLFIRFPFPHEESHMLIYSKSTGDHPITLKPDGESFGLRDIGLAAAGSGDDRIDCEPGDDRNNLGIGGESKRRKGQGGSSVIQPCLSAILGRLFQIFRTNQAFNIRTVGGRKQ